ncbi:diphosphate--fructose-6-phosphate 1-phosphotransferase [Bradyrhizobium diazoefficiens]|nr:diphosphate--fructose-6-phosphate 1-phosphotransferase [Bradyrhizobium diazoefficiens]UCF55569.1 MAG: diphosphate--fructose-6-phosphate 1-phosphotransferase [Bradyrhizobium sp.]MBR0968410.1 diphosphate--fructose-6-phosphate 1-phosphotransferase [Bradyrhizobium diazoefficiens]MBR0981728.1 diphosphate--fructose-6-phosphate 1-phosphotransferase [Bradyrhizobium diazoefficiens]MBR1011187.1 diphosphate--fructose-6-phosphate 1-phosphotransferase [Bradyrhizobium diazoefficiens]MBR1017681.1 diphosph
MPSIVIAQGGGPTAVINQTLCGAIVAARRHDPSLRILGARYGVRGLTEGNVVDLANLPETELRRLGNTPNSALGSTRDKPDSGTCAAILAALDRLDARAFVYIGGNDTAGTLELLRQQSSGPCHFVHAPKTIDNDLMENDHVPGFISAATFVANALVSMDLDFRAMPGIYVAIVMGRHAGFLSAAAAGWQQSQDDAPHLIYTPERPFSVVQFLDDVDAVYTRLGRCIVSMSEGVQDEAGRPLAEVLAGEAVERDAHGNLQLTGGDLGIAIQKALKSRFPKARSRVDTLGYLPRAYLGVIDDTDRKEAFDAGVFAAQSALSGSGSVVLHYDGERVEPRLVPLDRVAGKTRHMPDEFLVGSNTVSDQGRRYFRRLLPERPDLFPPFV